MQSIRITSLEEFIDLLIKCNTKNEYEEVCKDTKIDLKDLEKYTFFSDDFYARNCIYRDKDFELLLIAWKPGQFTNIHCHGGKECWVNVIQGEISEKIYQLKGHNLEHTKTTLEKEGDSSYINDHLGFHSLENTGQGNALSLHLYVSPIKECRSFNEEKNEFNWVKLNDFSYQGKLI